MASLSQPVLAEEGQSNAEPSAAATLEARMLSGEPFTYGGLCDTFGVSFNETRTRLIDRTIQKLRRKGLIAYRREGGAVTWRPVTESVAAGTTERSAPPREASHPSTRKEG